MIRPGASMRRRAVMLLAAMWLGAASSLPGSPAHAQQSGLGVGQIRSPVLVIDSEQFYRDSAYGLRILEELEQERAALATENRRIEAELTEEERALTEQRAELDPETFRDLANAFDEKVRAIRRAQDGKARALSQRLDERRGTFLNAAAPVLEEMMREAGAAVVLEQRSVFLSLNAIDITRAAITRINAELGDGAAPETPDTPDAPEAPETPDAPDTPQAPDAD